MKKIIVANWKMKLNIDEAINLAEEVKRLLPEARLIDKEVVLCPSFLALSDISKNLSGSSIHLGAQDVFYEEDGAFTGEISPENLKELDCKYVIVGHSERRAMGETYDLINKKVKAVLENDMIPIICVGETYEQYESGQTQNILEYQVNKALEGLDSVEGIKDKLVLIAYEPIWSISTSGSGQTISPEQANREIETIKKNIPKILEEYGILYGGSVTTDNVEKFTEEYDGVLVGSASLNGQNFFDLINKVKV